MPGLDRTEQRLFDFAIIMGTSVRVISLDSSDHCVTENVSHRCSDLHEQGELGKVQCYSQ